MIIGLQEKLGCSHEYLLWGETWINFQMKIADSPRIGKKKKRIETEDELRDFLDIHD